MPEFFECGCCGEYHPAQPFPAKNRIRHVLSSPDCRDDENRFTFEQLESNFPGWIDATIAES